MNKDKNAPANPHYADTHAKPSNPGNEPLSGSKKVKNKNHSHSAPSEGAGHH
ncbi:MAG: small acid-soluble spore protein P [Candidatus Pristimantibacillus lignocellulolyticus]|uniref:Small acid-soluble spore protein P n=1 Tax=Candidatus Pristimantibacillus lignocellulolyticus TaxID=2994561 RepID=A0A9J6ZJQ1_9BACL|nr:MAG: small acid-soluble spore protein P [Candidatus Pristimantibacillus lignocellulolyticus]